MDDLFKLIKTYRFTSGLTERLRLVEQIFNVIQPDLRLFVLSSVRPPASDDVCQEVFKAVATSLKSFKGNSREEFWAWCYRIARNKINDHFRKKASDRFEPMPEHELKELIDLSVQLSPPSASVKHDLDYAMKLLTSAKPECYDFLWKHYVFGLGYAEIAEEQKLTYDGVRMKIGRCLEEAKALVS